MGAIALDPEHYGLLREIIDETYNDRIDRIDEAWVFPDGQIQAFVTDEGMKLSVDIGEDISIFQTGEDASFVASFAAAKKRNCVKGIACGGTCISKGKTCSKKASAGQKEKAKDILALVHVPRKVEPKVEKPGKPAGGKKKSTGKKALSSDKIKEMVMRPVEWQPGDRGSTMSPQTKRINTAHNDIVKSLGEVGNPATISSEDAIKILNNIDGGGRSELLGATTKEYGNKKLAKEWYNKLSFKVHPDYSKGGQAANDAFSELEDMYNGMIGRGTTGKAYDK